MANEADLKLIQIGDFPETETMAGSGAEYIVIRKADGTTFKIRTSDFIEEIGISGPSSMGGVVPNTAFVPEMGSVGNPAIYFAGAGVYPGFGGITLTEPLNVISWDGSVAVVKGVPIEVPPAINETPDWVAGAYSTGQQRFWKGQVWEVSSGVATTTQEPGTGGDWVGKIDKVAGSQILYSKNLFKKTNIRTGFVIRTLTGLVEADSKSAITGEIPVEGNKLYALSGRNNTGAQSGRFINALGEPLLPKTPDGTDYPNYTIPPNTVFLSPVNAVAFQFTYRYDNVGTVDSVQFEQSNQVTGYQEYKELLKTDLLPPSPDYLLEEDILTPGKNLFDKTAIIHNKYISAGNGAVITSPGSIISPIIPVKGNTIYFQSGKNATVTSSAIFYNSAGVLLRPIELDGSPRPTFTLPLNGAFLTPPTAVGFQFAIKYESNIGSADAVQVELGSVQTAYEPYKKTLRPELVNIPDQSDSATKEYIDNKIFGSAQIQDQAITPQKLSNETKQLIEASGGGTINNAADGEDLTVTEDFLIRLKDGAEGFARIRNKDTFAQLKAEIETKAISYGNILIKDSLDFKWTESARNTITIPDGTVIKFVGNGRLKNVRLQGKFHLIADRRQVFENVEFFEYNHNGNAIRVSSNFPNFLVPAGFPTPLFDRRTKTIIGTTSANTIDPFYVRPFTTTVANFQAPVAEGANFVLKSAGKTIWAFGKNGSNQILIPTSDRFIVTNLAGVVQSPGSYVDPSTVKVGVVQDWGYSSLCTVLNGDVYPEWFGASTVNSDNKKALNLCLSATSYMGGADISLDKGTYFTDGGLIPRDNLKIKGSAGSMIKLKSGATNHLFIRNNFSMLYNFSFDSIVLDGNKANNLATQFDGFSDSWQYGETNSYIDFSYSWESSMLIKTHFQNFSGHGFYPAIPGDVNLFSCRFEFNRLDGVRWDKEHLKLYECIAWGNGRYGLYTLGFHFRIVGGAYAHNAINNIRLEGCFEFQIVGPSVIDCLEHGLYMHNCHKYTITAPRVQTSGKAGIYSNANGYEGMIIGAVTFDNNRKDIVGSTPYNYNQDQAIPDTRVYEDITCDSGTTAVIGALGTSNLPKVSNSSATTIEGLKSDLNNLIQEMKRNRVVS